ncbi:MAG TPA: 50S ribosomal protein L22 [Rhodospirillaceae bacterium]|nr:50S ribosomal protein L22 [Rhodospirillaceae bacterium]
MSKKTAPRDLPDTEAKAFAASIRTSPRKLNLVAQSIRGLKAEAALAQLTFSPRRVAEVVKKVLQSAIANAENNHQLDVDRLVVAEAYVGKALVMKRFSPRARGRVGHIVKPFSNLTVIVRESQDTAGQEKA